jgi:thioredoxin 1
MNKTAKIAIVTVLILVVGAVIVLKEKNKAGSESKDSENIIEDVTTKEKQPAESNKAESPRPLPRLVDLGADKCIPCKMMAPILKELKEEYAGRLEVVFLDVWKNPELTDKYNLRLIPTQIFYDASGKELFRHEGFYSREDILAKYKQLGIELDKAE